MKTLLTLIGLSLLCEACALTPQTVQLKPDIQLKVGDVAKGREITVVTVDERTRSVIGNRTVGAMGANITTEEDVAAIIHTSIVDGLRKKGFAIKTSLNPADPRELRAEVRNIEYTVTPGIFSGTLRTEAAIKAVCNINKNREYEHLYRAEVSDWILVVQFAEANEKRINESLSKVIQTMLDDDQLITCLLK